MSSKRYDLAVIGSGPAGQKAAIAATKLGRRVAIIDAKGSLGGVCLTTGTIPSKTLREAVLYLTGFRQRAIYGKSYRLQNNISADDLDQRVQHVIMQQQDVVQDQLRRNGVEILEGLARFADANTVEVETARGRETIDSEFILVACGTRPARREGIPFDHPHVMDADQLYETIHGDGLPRSGIIVGAGVIGLEYASMMAALGIKVTVIDTRDTMLTPIEINGESTGYGFGFRVGEHAELGPAFSHGGGQAGTTTFLIYFREPQIGVALISNRDRSGGRQELAIKLATIASGQPAAVGSE